MTLTRRNFLKLAGILPVLGKIAKDLLPFEPEIDELELEAWDKSAWAQWETDIEFDDTGILTTFTDNSTQMWMEPIQ